MIRFLAVAAVAAVLYGVLGAAVSHVPPRGIDIAGRGLTGEAPQVAMVFTASCWWPTLVTLGVAAIVLGAVRPAWRARAFGSVALVCAMWLVSDTLKNMFRRPRPEYWILIREPTFAYSSGHAMFATLVYAAWAVFLWKSSLPRSVRLIVTPALSLWACGVVWSRLALGAHYVTDLIGGILLAVTALALWSAVRAAPTAAAVGTRQHGH